MAEIQPFRAYRYDTNRVALKDVLTQPYDKITPEMQEQYYAASPYNLIADRKRPHAAGRYAHGITSTRAPRKKCDEWIAEKILAQGRRAEHLHLFAGISGARNANAPRRIGFIALGRVEDYDAQVVFRHERTLSAPKADRIELLRHTRAQTGQLFMLYDDPARVIDTLLEETARKTRAARDAGRIRRDAPPVAGVRSGIRAQNPERDGGQEAGDRGWPPSLRNGAELSQRRPRESRQQRTAGSLRIRDDDVHQHALEGTDDSADAPRGGKSSEFRFREISQIAWRPYFDWYSYPFQNPRGARDGLTRNFARIWKSQSHGRRAIGVYPGGGRVLFCFCCGATPISEALLPDISEAQRGLDVVLLHRLILEKGLGITAEAVAAEKNVGLRARDGSGHCRGGPRRGAARVPAESRARPASGGYRAGRRRDAAEIDGLLSRSC